MKTRQLCHVHRKYILDLKMQVKSEKMEKGNPVKTSQREGCVGKHPYYKSEEENFWAKSVTRPEEEYFTTAEVQVLQCFKNS